MTKKKKIKKVKSVDLDTDKEHNIELIKIDRDYYKALYEIEQKYSKELDKIIDDLTK